MDNIIDVFKDESYTCSISQEPVTLAQAKAQCRVDFSDDDSFITTLISQCRAAIESYCNISLVCKTVTATIENRREQIAGGQYVYGIGSINAYNSISRWDYNFYGIGMASKWFELPYGPVRSITSVTMISLANPPVIQILTNNEGYFTRGTSFLQMMAPNWSDNMLVVYYAGYVDVPNDLKLSILNEIAFRYEVRGDVANRYAQQNVGICEAARILADPYRRIWL